MTYSLAHMRVSTTSRASLLAFVTAFVTLFTQVLINRVVSAKLLNNFAFLVISLTMLGFALSGVVLSRSLPRLLERLDDVIVWASALFALTLVGASVVFYRAEVGVLFVTARPDFVRAFLRCIPLALLYAVPFAFAGGILGLLLSDTRFSMPRVYGADLVGSAVGAVAVIPAIGVLGAEAGLLLSAALLLGVTVALAPPRAPGTWALVAAAAVALGFGLLAPDRAFRMRYPPGSALAGAVAEGRLEKVVWDPVSRIEVMRIQPPDPDTSAFPALMGEDRAFLSRFKRQLTQNNNAPTFAVEWDGRRESLEGLRNTVYAAAYKATAVAAPKVVVIGVGGGFDVLTGLYFGAGEITGVEVNAATLRLVNEDYREYCRPWAQDPRVRLVHGEGRNFLATSPGGLDIIQISGVDSFSGTPAAAHVFSENYLYTVEAFDLFLSRLSPAGIVNVMRFEYVPPQEMLRVLTTAVAALRRGGASQPADHLVMLAATNGRFASLLVKRTPFTGDELRRLTEWVTQGGLLEVAAGPHLQSGGTPNLYREFLSLRDPGLEAAFAAGYPFDITPVFDDKPFFFHRSFWWHVFPKSAFIRAATPAMEYALILLFGIMGVASLICVYLPLTWLSPERRPAGWTRWALFFAGIGIGYMAIEIALLQRFGLFLGHPNLALSGVLAALLFSTGLGALAAQATVSRLGHLRFVSYVLAGVVLFEHLVVFPALPRLMGWPLSMRALVMFLLVLPVGFCLGTFFPEGLSRLRGAAPAFVPWAWGVNGIFSVLAPVVAVAVSMTWGISALLISAIPIYLLAAWALPLTASPLSE
jgi:hypothetical protein